MDCRAPSGKQHEPLTGVWGIPSANIWRHPFGELTKCSAFLKPWWRHQMETFSALLAICAGNSPVPGEFPAQRPVTWSFDVFFDLRPNKRLSKQSWGWWSETPSSSLWRHRNDYRACNSHDRTMGFSMHTQSMPTRHHICFCLWHGKANVVIWTKFP